MQARPVLCHRLRVIIDMVSQIEACPGPLTDTADSRGGARLYDR
jgi:hypothetical protein